MTTTAGRFSTRAWQGARPAPRPIRTRPRRRRCSLAGTALLLLAPAAVDAAFVLPDPQNAAYYDFAISAGERIQLAKDSTISGNLHSNGDVEIQAHTRVVGDVSAVGSVDGDGEVTGAVTEGADPLALPQPFTAAEAGALADRLFTGDTSFDNDEVVDDVVFVDGSVTFRAALNGTGTVIASGSILLEKGVPGQLADETLLSLVAGQEIVVKKDREVRAALVAGGNVTLDKEAIFEGVIVSGGQALIKKEANLPGLELDQTPPVISDLTPADGSEVTDTGPTISAAFSDNLSGVDVSSVLLLVDGVDRTAEAAVAPAGVTYSPAAELDPGSHTVEVSLADQAGNAASASWSFTIASGDAEPPTLAIGLVQEPVVVHDPVLTFPVFYTDFDSGVDLASLAVAIDGIDLTGSCQVGDAVATCTTPLLASGAYTVTAAITDQAGNPSAASAGIVLTVDLQPPALTLASPPDGLLTSATSVEAAGTVTDDGELLQVAVNRAEVVVTDGEFSVLQPLSEGSNDIQVVAIDTSGRQSSAQAIVIRDTAPPALTIAFPQPGLSTNAASLRVSGSAADANGIAELEVGGAPVPVVDGRYETSVALAEGANTIVVEAGDPAGNVASASVQVTRFTVPSIAITAPADLSLIAGTEVDVSGVVAGSGVAVDVNGVAAVVAGESFTASSVPLGAGGTIVNARAIDAAGRIASDSLLLLRDVEPPSLTIDHPADGSRLFDASVNVFGLINDVVPGTVNSDQAAVTVNGVAAQVSNRSYLAVGVPLTPGANQIVAEAVDQAGNSAQRMVSVTRLEATVARIAADSGNNQAAPVATTLASPLVARLLDASGSPVAGATVIFRVLGNDGALNTDRRRVAVTTGADGRAAVSFTLGSRAGNQVVEAVATGFAGRALFNVMAEPGAPAFLIADSGDQQTGAAGARIPQSLVAVVTDAAFNRLGGEVVTFRISAGGGVFANGLTETAVTSLGDGRAVVRYVLGPEEGIANNTVCATLDAVPGAPTVSFVASALIAGDSAATAVSGVVLDNTNDPVPGVTVHIESTGLTAQTDAGGFFRLTGAPVGTLHLLVDGATATRPGTWPTLEFVLTTVAGRDNDLGMPIFLLPLDLVNAVPVDETTGGVLTLPEVPGFALEIAPGSVTFPDGSRSGEVSVTPVHHDKVPMVPNFGIQPRFIVTVQPPGAHFDPPARLVLPNLNGLPPGLTTEMFSFDHDLFRFVGIGPGTVSEDGLLVVSDPGVGIVKGGWHGGGDPPDEPGCAHNCSLCSTCESGSCVADDSQTPAQSAPDDCKQEICRNGSTTSIPDESETPQQDEGNCLHENCRGEREVDLGDGGGLECCWEPAHPSVGPFLYDPATECCERDPFGLPNTIPKTPIINPLICPRRVKKEGHVGMSNGCTGVSPNPAGGMDTHFSNLVDRPCDLHDICYSTCKPQGTTDEAYRSQCDQEFCVNLEQTCNNATDTDVGVLTRCFFYAEIYCTGVGTLGGPFYFGGQSEACQCCP